MKSIVIYSRKFVALLALALVCVSFSCSRQGSTGSEEGQITVAAAISLKDAFLSLAQLYQERTGDKVNYSFGASGELMRQIEAGAPIDVFASAGQREMDDLQSKGMVEIATRADFARNSLAIVLPAGSKLDLNAVGDLARPGVKRISIGNPKTVPAGMYAHQLLVTAHLWEQLQPRLIFAENVRQVLEYVERGEVSAGIVYSTDVAIAHGRVQVAARAPDGTYGPILYPIAKINGSPHQGAAREFVRFVLGPDGQRELQKFGFLPVKSP
ncbi:MAG TPA: molybdate ABC transporter substrate-binding protein [Terriglobia bacterium]|nr:molybdate ABC transporter substrate-binding protein [Terriglobia bacterium]